MTIKNKATKEKTTLSTYVVGIGASAGGLEAINEFFENTPINTGFSYILVQHLSPDYKSLMPELLAKHTLMKVVEAEDDMPLKANCVYLLPSKKFLTISGGRLYLKEKIKNNLPNNAIDVFFESLANEMQSMAVGVILSGTGTDGTKGLEFIKKKGGIAIVQDPITASFDGMPNSAISAGVADLILPPENMIEELLEFLKESKVLKAYQLNSYRDEFVLRDIIMMIRRETGQDFSYYKRPTLFRRLSKRLLELNITRLKDYVEYLHQHPNELKTISQDFLINVTYFFRDKEAFDQIQNTVIPAIMKDKTHGDTVKAWSVACSSGEEAYSLAILFHEYVERKKIYDLNIKIFATDIDRDALEKASKGLYSKSSVQDISEPRVKKYFTQEGENFRINSEIRKMIVFSYHDILKDPPFSRMDLITCRNMLIYIGAEAQKEIIRKVHFALNIDGYLVLGPSEHIGYAMGSMQEVDKKWRIYKNVTKAKTNEKDALFSPIERGFSLSPIQHKVKNPLNHIPDLFKDTILEEYQFAGIFIDANLEVKQATGNYKKYVDLPDAGFNFNIMKLVAPDLGIALNIAIRKAMKENETVTMKRVKVKRDKETKLVNITVKPYIKHKEYQQEFLFIVLKDESAENVSSREGKTIEPQLNRIEEIEEELKETKENLQAVIEEIEAANEELQSTNEEMVSTNEELQSTNEELQSLNEELHTVSAEHQLKIKELMELNDDMNNYFRNSEIGQILIDHNMIIRKFSPAATRMVNLIDSDINRSILDITTKFNSLDFITDVKKVMNDGKPVKKEISLGPETYLMRITPYVKQDTTTEGVVINFIDISETKKLNSILTAVLDSSPSSICAMRAIRNERSEIIDFEYIAANSAHEKELGVESGGLIGKCYKNFSPDEAQVELYKSVAESGKSKHFEHFDEKKKKWFDVVLVKLMDGVVCISTEITDKKKAIELIAKGYDDLMETSRKLRNTNLKLEQSNMDLLQFASVASHDLKEPLRKIQTFGNLLLTRTKEKLSESELNHLEKMVSASGRMQRLIEDVLTLSKLSNSEKNYEEVNLNEVLNLIRDDLEITVKEKNADIVVKDLPKVKAITGQMHQIFQNLLSNALKFTNGSKPKVVISEIPVKKKHAEHLKIKPEDYTCISVKDNGIGFEETYKDKIFGIFQRLNGSNYDGTGIGLAICKKIVENHNGHITVESELHKGSEFFIFLPK
jgi:two-component system, chemotaxis family, CheB/CheR fusion protein